MLRTRTALLYVIPAAAIVLAWARLERPQTAVAKAVAVALVALAPGLVRTRWLRPPAVFAAALLAAWIALEGTLAHPLQIFTRLWNGVLEFYDVALPYDPTEHPHMQGAVLVAVFVFCLAAALGLARGRPLAACAAVVVGAGWPGTLLRGGDQLLLGILVLAAVLAILAGLRPQVSRALVGPAVIGGAVVACALGFSSTASIARGELVHWEGWDLYTKPDPAVDVSYVWNSDYTGLRWPKKSTTVLRIEAPGRALYWRATTLDAYVDGASWIEDLSPAVPAFSRVVGVDDLSHDPLLPRRAQSRDDWIEQRVTVDAFRDRHLVGADGPVAYQPGDLHVSYARGGVALVAPGSDRGKEYTVWSYVPRPTPAQLARSQPLYPPEISDQGRYLTVDRGVSVPPFGTPGRDGYVADLISTRLSAYSRLYAAAKRVVGRATSPYAAVVGLESWFRDSGRFHYDEHPPVVGGVPPLVSFVAETRRGYCQHFAGAMALMLRYLGIPARVGAGFTSGTYDGRRGVWTVSNRDAHTWVEVWFRGYGWLPFDPTPGRGGLGASYTASSKSFDARGAAKLLAVVGGGLQSLLENRAKAQIAAARGERARSIPVSGSGSRSHTGLVLFGILLLVVVAAAAALFALKLARRRLRYLRADARRTAAACRRELVDFLRDQAVQVPPSATLEELGRTVGDQFAVAPDAFVSAASSARFGAPTSARAAADRARRELRELERGLRRRLTRTERFAGALSLRSLRAA